MMDDATKRCKGCEYWRAISPTAQAYIKCCQYMLETGKRRERDGDVCLSRKDGERKRMKNPFDIPFAQRKE